MSGHILSPRQSSSPSSVGELVATIARIIWQGDEGESVICDTTTAGKCVIEGAAGLVAEGETYRLLGAYTNNPVHGRQFKASAFLPHASHDKRGVVKYLSSNCDGIAQGLATRIWEKYGSDAVRTLRDEPERVSHDCQIDPLVALHASQDLDKIKQFEATTIDLHSLFAGRGLGASAVAACIRRWKLAASVLARKNPFGLLLAGIPRAGFKTCDRLYLELGGDPAALKRQAIAGWDALDAAGTGSTWHPRGLFDRGIAKQVGEGKGDATAALRLATRRAFGIGPMVCSRGPWLAAPADAVAEAGLAECVRRLFTAEVGRWPEVSTPQVSQHQADKWNTQVENQLVLVTGPPGVGKTTLLAAVIKQLVPMYGQNAIGVCAPTGKAGRRMTQGLRSKGVDLEATTIHRLLRVGRNGHDGKGWGFEFNESNPLTYHFLIVDESSMIDLKLAYALFSAISPGTCVCLVGDEAQLPPVGGGAPLRDLIRAGMPSCKLTVPMRNGGLIQKAMQAIDAGGPVEFCETLDPVSGQNLKFIECVTEADQLAVLDVVLKAIQMKANTSLPRDVFVLTPRNEGSLVSRTALNARLSLTFNPHAPGDTVGAAEGWRLRDRVICRSNTFTDAMECTPKLAEHDVNSYRVKATTIYDDVKVFVANGDLGSIVATCKQRPEVVVKFDDPKRFVKWRLGGKKVEGETTIGGKKDDLQHACALSGHLFQGSEAPWIILMVDEGGGRVASKEYWYTSIGRATHACIMIGKRSAFEKQRRRAELPGRKTFLTELLLEKVVDDSEAADGACGVGDLVEIREEGEDGR